MAQRDDMRWRVMRPASLRVRRWDDMLVVYDDRSGDTHLLADPAGRVLERLLASGAGRDELLALTGGAHDGGEQRVQQRVQLFDVLERLRRLGIVKPVRK